METPHQRAIRLLAALEEFVGQESNLLRGQDFAGAIAIQARATPLVEELAALAVDPGVAALQPWVAVLIERREENSRFMDRELERLRGELRRVEEANSRLAKVAPAYVGVVQPTVPRLNTAA